MSSLLDYEKWPFFLGMQDAPQILDFPPYLNFELSFNKEIGLIEQKRSELLSDWLRKAYEYGSSLSTPVGEGTFGKRVADDIIENLSLSLQGRRIEETSFLELGCNRGYLLSELKMKGAKRVFGMDPDPNAQIGAKKYNIDILHDFYPSSQLTEKFDVAFTYGTLEHLDSPLDFLKDMKGAVNESGIVFTAVPDCEYGLNVGDLSILCHEHLSYFTENSLVSLYEQAGYKNIKVSKSKYGWVLYVWGSCEDLSNEAVAINYDKELDLCEKFVSKAKNITSRLEALVEEHNAAGDQVGIYGPYALYNIFNFDKELRYFDGDVAKHGKYLPGCLKPVESPQNLLSDPTDVIWVTPINHDDAIRGFLENELNFPKEKIISIKSILEEN